MLINDKLKQVLKGSGGVTNKFFLRTLLKDALQDYVLRFIYESEKFKDLIFTGGTCVKKIYGLPRFSEDLDFDYFSAFDIKLFEKEIVDYFAKDLQYKDISTKIANNKQTIFLKFPILEELGLAQSSADKQILFLRCDLAKQAGYYTTEVNQISTEEYSFFVLSYDLPTLFANKIIAFLQREFFKSKTQTESFKGRDIFDLVWFMEQSAKTSFAILPNWERVFNKLKVKSKNEIFKMLLAKLEKINKEDLKYDLFPFVADQKYINILGDNFFEIIKNKGEIIFKKTTA